MTSTDERPPPAGAGRLYLVATPIGNLADASPRSVEVLREADLILAEDTRRTRILLGRHGIARPVRAFDARREHHEAGRIVERIASGERVALVSDAGTPCVSDPGAALVRAVSAAGLVVVPVPGPSAVTAAVCAAGVQGGFAFLGFLARRGKERERQIARILRSEEAVVIFESPVRTPATLADLEKALGPDREVVLCRELSKIHEEIAAGTAGDLARRFAGGVLGEVTLVVMPPSAEVRAGGSSPAARAARPAPEPEAMMARLLEEGLPPSRAARVVADLLGIPRGDAYEMAHRRR